MEFANEGSNAQWIDPRPHKHPYYFKIKFGHILLSIIALYAEINACRMENNEKVKKIVENVCYLSVVLAMFDMVLEFIQPYWLEATVFNFPWRVSSKDGLVFLPLMIFVGMLLDIYVLVCIKLKVATNSNFLYITIWVSATQFALMLEEFLPSLVRHRLLLQHLQAHQQLTKNSNKGT